MYLNGLKKVNFISSNCRKETADFLINKDNINVFIEILKIFGILSKAHKQDTINIIATILK